MPEKEKMNFIHEVIIFATRKHDGQMRNETNNPYFSHVTVVMRILTENDCSENVIIADVLHYVKDTRRFP